LLSSSLSSNLLLPGIGLGGVEITADVVVVVQNCLFQSLCVRVCACLWCDCRLKGTI